MYLDPIASVALLLIPLHRSPAVSTRRPNSCVKALRSRCWTTLGGPVSQVAGLISPWCDTHKSNLKDQ